MITNKCRLTEEFIIDIFNVTSPPDPHDQLVIIRLYTHVQRLQGYTEYTCTHVLMASKFKCGLLKLSQVLSYFNFINMQYIMR